MKGSLLTCGFAFARFSIFSQASSLSFHLVFSLRNKTKPLHHEASSDGKFYSQDALQNSEFCGVVYFCALSSFSISNDVCVLFDVCKSL